MDALLWALQIVLGVKRLPAADTRGVRPDQTKMPRGRGRRGAGRIPQMSRQTGAPTASGIPANSPHAKA